MDKKTIFYILLGSATVGVVSGAYLFIKSLLSHDEEELQTNTKKHDDHKEKEESNFKKEEKKLSLSDERQIAIQIYTEIIKVQEEALGNYDTDNIKRERLRFLGVDDNEYITQAGKVIGLKWRIYEDTQNSLCRKHILTPERFHKILIEQNIPVVECDHHLFSYWKPKLPSTIPSKSTVKQLFLKTGHNFFKMIESINKSSQLLPSQEMEQIKLVEKQKIEDELWRSSGMSIVLLKYFVYVHNLYDDKDIALYYNYFI